MEREVGGDFLGGDGRVGDGGEDGELAFFAEGRGGGARPNEGAVGWAAAREAGAGEAAHAFGEGGDEEQWVRWKEVLEGEGFGFGEEGLEFGGGAFGEPVGPRGRGREADVVGAAGGEPAGEEQVETAFEDLAAKGVAGAGVFEAGDFGEGGRRREGGDEGGGGGVAGGGGGDGGKF